MPIVITYDDGAGVGGIVVVFCDLLFCEFNDLAFGFFASLVFFCEEGCELLGFLG